VILMSAPHQKSGQQAAQAVFAYGLASIRAHRNTGRELSVRDIWSVMNISHARLSGVRRDFPGAFEIPIASQPGGPSINDLFGAAAVFASQKTKREVRRNYRIK
jgi:hypothetical protein